MQKGYVLTITLLLVAVFLFIGYIILKDGKLQNKLTNSNLQTSCELYGGRWIPEHNECEWFIDDNCAKFGGTYNDCASPCRHDPDAKACSKKCVQICTFDSN